MQPFHAGLYEPIEIGQRQLESDGRQRVRESGRSSRAVHAAVMASMSASRTPVLGGYHYLVGG